MSENTHQEVQVTQTLLALIMVLAGNKQVAAGTNYLMSGTKNEDDDWAIVRRQFLSTYAVQATRCGLSLNEETFETLKKIIQQNPCVTFDIPPIHEEDVWMLQIGPAIFYTAMKIA